MTKALLQYGQLPDEFQEQTGAWFMATAAGDARTGVLPTTTGALVTPASTPGPTVNIGAFHAVINGTGTTPGCFVYGQAGDTVDVLSGAGAAGTAPRNDIIGVRVVTGVSSETTSTAPIVVRGRPANPPADPGVPDNFLPLARVRVGAGATTVTAAMIDQLWAPTALRGGLIVAASRAARDGIPAAYLLPGQRCWVVPERVEYTWTGTGWSSGDTGWKTLPMYSNWKSYRNDPNHTPQYRVVGGICYVRGMIQPAFAPTPMTSPDTGLDVMIIPPDARQALTGSYIQYVINAKTTSGPGLYRLDYGTDHRLRVKAPSTGAAIIVNNDSWFDLGGLSWPVG